MGDTEAVTEVLSVALGVMEGVEVRLPPASVAVAQAEGLSVGVRLPPPATTPALPLWLVLREREGETGSLAAPWTLRWMPG